MESLPPPGKPGKPLEPDKPDKPDKPEKPGKPDPPGKPNMTKPNMTKPDKPDKPDKPGQAQSSILAPGPGSGASSTLPQVTTSKSDASVPTSISDPSAPSPKVGSSLLSAPAATSTSGPDGSPVRPEAGSSQLSSSAPTSTSVPGSGTSHIGPDSTSSHAFPILASVAIAAVGCAVLLLLFILLYKRWRAHLFAKWDYSHNLDRDSIPPNDALPPEHRNLRMSGFVSYPKPPRSPQLDTRFAPRPPSSMQQLQPNDGQLHVNHQQKGIGQKYRTSRICQQYQSSLEPLSGPHAVIDSGMEKELPVLDSSNTICVDLGSTEKLHDNIDDGSFASYEKLNAADPRGTPSSSPSTSYNNTSGLSPNCPGSQPRYINRASTHLSPHDGPSYPSPPLLLRSQTHSPQLYPQQLPCP